MTDLITQMDCFDLGIHKITYTIVDYVMLELPKVVPKSYLGGSVYELDALKY